MAFRPITAGALEADIYRIISSKNTHYKAITYDVTIHTPTEDILLTHLTSIEISRDYVNNITDYILVSFLIPLGTYAKKLRVTQDNLEATITINYYNIRYPTRYKLVLQPIETMAGSGYSSYTEAELNKMDMIHVEAQCLSRLVESIRLQPVSGIYNYTTVSKLIKTVISDSIKKVKIDNNSVDHLINVVPPNNDKIYRHLVLPTGVRVLDLPSFLQNTSYGVYSADLGTYVQKSGYYTPNKKPIETVYVYPLYNYKLLPKTGNKLMILSTPNARYTKSERSYVIEGNTIKIVGNSDVSGNEISQNLIMQNGNAVIVADPDKIMLNGGVHTDSDLKTVSKDNLVGSNVKPLVSGNNNANYIGPRNNKYLQYSEIAKNTLSNYSITWNHSNAELLHPGMAVMYIYEDEKRGVVRLSGVIHSLFTKYSEAYKVSATVINLLLEPYNEGIINSNKTVDVRY